MQKCHAHLIRIIFSVSVERGGVLHVRHDQLSKTHVLLAVDDSCSGWINANNPVGVDLELDLAHGGGKGFSKSSSGLVDFLFNFLFTGWQPQMGLFSYQPVKKKENKLLQ